MSKYLTKYGGSLTGPDMGKYCTLGVSLGDGAYGSVKEAKQPSGPSLACKSLNKATIPQAGVCQVLAGLQKLSHLTNRIFLHPAFASETGLISGTMLAGDRCPPQASRRRQRHKAVQGL